MFTIIRAQHRLKRWIRVMHQPLDQQSKHPLQSVNSNQTSRSVQVDREPLPRKSTWMQSFSDYKPSSMIGTVFSFLRTPFCSFPFRKITNRQMHRDPIVTAVVFFCYSSLSLSHFSFRTVIFLARFYYSSFYWCYWLVLPDARILLALLQWWSKKATERYIYSFFFRTSKIYSTMRSLVIYFPGVCSLLSLLFDTNTET